MSIHSNSIFYCCEDNFVMEHYCHDRFIRQFGFHQDVPVDMDFNNLRDPETILHYHYVLKRYGAGSQVTLPWRCSLLEGNATRAFHEWWSEMFISPTCNQHNGDSKRKQGNLSNTNISKENDIAGFKPKLKIIRSGKPLEPYVSSIEGDSSHTKILGINITIPTKPILTVPIQRPFLSLHVMS